MCLMCAHQVRCVPAGGRPLPRDLCAVHCQHGGVPQLPGPGRGAGHAAARPPVCPAAVLRLRVPARQGVQRRGHRAVRACPTAPFAFVCNLIASLKLRTLAPASCLLFLASSNPWMFSNWLFSHRYKSVGFVTHRVLPRYYPTSDAGGPEDALAMVADLPRAWA